MAVGAAASMGPRLPPWPSWWRYERCDEFLDVVRRLWAGETVTTDGTHIRVEGASLATLPNPLPPLYFGGSSAAAGPVAARHADVYLTWGEPPAAVREKIEWIRALAEEQDRRVRLGFDCTPSPGIRRTRRGRKQTSSSGRHSPPA
jgi:alkanesulfonate monooxygenase SsuD/methylene tetrahydromethanopterin reductase-like flavin-dependent oxidoreductase (luciferase family)